MQELSMNILDIAENSVKAGASLTEIDMSYLESERLVITIADNGCGMSKETVERVTDPFFTSRTTRNVGLGVPFYKMAAEMTGGGLDIDSEPGRGTTLTATFYTNHIDMMPLGDIGSSVAALMQGNPDKDFVFTVRRGEDIFTADSREIKAILEGVPIDNPNVAIFIREFIAENILPILEREK